MFAGVEMFKQEVPTVGLAVLEGVPPVPSDGHYYVLHDGREVFKSKSRKLALEFYRELRDRLISESGIEMPRPDPADRLRKEREFFDVNAVYVESFKDRVKKSRGRGGRGGRGGV